MPLYSLHRVFVPNFTLIGLVVFEELQCDSQSVNGIFDFYKYRRFQNKIGMTSHCNLKNVGNPDIFIILQAKDLRNS